MGKITQDTKEITKPFEIKPGKRLVKITMGGKTLTLQLPIKYTLSAYGELKGGGKSFGRVTAIGVSSGAHAGNTTFWDIRPMYGQPHVRYLYTKDTGANKNDKLIDAFPLIPKGKNAKLTFITTAQFNPETTSGWTEHKYELIYNPDGSVSFNSNTVALNANKMVWQFSFSGGWIQTWIYNTPTGVQFKYGGGSGVPMGHFLVIKDIEL